MKIEYREFRKKDLLKVKEFTEVMPTYFEDWNSYAPVILANEDCFFYGAFQEEKIIGLGNLRKKTENLAWIELIRVRPDNQLKGIGTKLFRFGDEKAKEMDFRIVGFATEGGNIGSNNIGKKLGFKLIAEMIPFWVESDKPKIMKVENPGEPITIDEALDLVQKIPNGPKDYIAIGWDFVPLEKSIFEKEPDMKFYAKNKTLLLEYQERDAATNEISWIKAMVYGAEDDVEYLLSDFVNRTKDLSEYLGCITTNELQHIPEKMEFIHSKSDDGRHNSIVMFEKKL